LICFEDVFPELSRRFVKEGADFLINITNDAWYKKTSAAEQHLAASVFRAVENRRYLVRSANTGISCFILPTGIISSSVSDKRGEQLFVDGYLTRDIPLIKSRNSFYTRYGDLFVAVCAFICLCGALRKGRSPQG
jgi:apolipoprotein N-acyltransferase